MSTIVTRSGKGSPLTHTEVDNNFTNLNTDKLQSGDTAASLVITSADINGGTIDGATIGASSASTGAFTTLAASGTTTLSGNQIISVTDNTNAALRITQLGTGNALLVEDSSNPDASPFVIDNAGNTYIGSLTSNAPSAVAGCEFQVNSLGTTQASIFAAQWGVNGAGSAQILLAHSLSGARGTQTIVGSGTALGKIRSFGSDGTNFIEATSIESYVDGTPGTNDMPGRLVFSTTADGSSSPTERMRINSSGNVGIGGTSAGERLRVVTTGNNPQISATNGTVVQRVGYAAFDSAIAGSSSNHPYVLLTNDIERMRIDTSGNLLVGLTSATSGGGVLQVSNGITFPATQSASSNANTLDDYEEGTWTPAFSVGGISGSNLSYSGTYTKIGRVVTVIFQATSTTSSNDVVISSYAGFTGLPFSASGIGATGSVATEDIDIFSTLGFSSVSSTTLVLSKSGSSTQTSTLRTSVTYFTS
jgi:hypothetical protein